MDSHGFWLFDLDGTLVDVDWSHVRAVFDEIDNRLGRSFTDREIALLWHGFAGERNTVLESRDIDVERFWNVFHDVEDPQQRAAATYLYEDAEWVGSIERPVGLVTHCQSHLTDAVLDRLDIRDWFDVVICCDDEIGWKPNPAPIHLAMSSLGVQPPQGGLYVGDGPHDVGAAWNAGLDAVHVERHGHDQRGACVRADRRCRSLTEIAPETTVGIGCELPRSVETIQTPPVPERV